MQGNQAGLEKLWLDIAADAARGERRSVLGSIGDRPYVPSMAIVGRIVERTLNRRRFTMPPHLLPRTVELAGIRLPRMIGAALSAVGISPAMLAAAVVTHAGVVLALGTWLAPSLLVYPVAPAAPRSLDRVTLVALPYAHGATAMGDTPRTTKTAGNKLATTLEPSMAVRREVARALNQVLVFDTQDTDLDSASTVGFDRIVTILTLKPDVELRLEVSGDGERALRPARIVAERLAARGVPRSQVTARVIVSRDSCDAAPRSCPPPPGTVRVRVIGVYAEPR